MGSSYCKCFITTRANAETKTFRWTPPTQYEDNSNLPAAEIAGYNLICEGIVVAAINGPVASYNMDFAPGAYTCRLRTRGTNGLISGPSNDLTFTVAVPLPPTPVSPKAPTDFSVE